MPASWKWLPEVVSQPAVELVEVVAVAMKCVRVSRKTTQMQRILHRIPKREWITDREDKH